MASLCSRCAVRLYAIPEARILSPTLRTFTTTAARYKKQVEIPRFAKTDDAELNDVLRSMRQYHIIPAYVTKKERVMIYGANYKQFLQDNSFTTTVGKETVKLDWVDKRTEIPNRTKLYNRTLELMSQGDAKNWDNFPPLIRGLRTAGTGLTPDQMEKAIRLMSEARRFDVLIQCLEQTKYTGLPLSDSNALITAMSGVRAMAQDTDWSAAGVQRAMKNMQQIAAYIELLLEKKSPKKQESVLSATVIALVLEMAAIHAYKHNSANDEDGAVLSYARKLLAEIEWSDLPNPEPLPHGPQLAMQRYLPIWHGLHLARKISGTELGESEELEANLKEYETKLAALAEALEAKQPEEGSYDHAALTAWKKCIRT